MIIIAADYLGIAIQKLSGDVCADEPSQPVKLNCPVNVGDLTVYGSLTVPGIAPSGTALAASGFALILSFIAFFIKHISFTYNYIDVFHFKCAFRQLQYLHQGNWFGWKGVVLLGHQVHSG